MPLWTLLVWLVIGGVVGFLAPKIMGKHSGLGQMGDLVLGLIGALAAGYGLALVGLGSLGLSGMSAIVSTFVAAVAGALLLIWVGRKLKHNA